MIIVICSMILDQIKYLYLLVGNLNASVFAAAGHDWRVLNPYPNGNCGCINYMYDRDSGCKECGKWYGGVGGIFPACTSCKNPSKMKDIWSGYCDCRNPLFDKSNLCDSCVNDIDSTPADTNCDNVAKSIPEWTDYGSTPAESRNTIDLPYA
jgi:hypothetical protein